MLGVKGGVCVCVLVLVLSERGDGNGASFFVVHFFHFSAFVLFFVLLCDRLSVCCVVVISSIILSIVIGLSSFFAFTSTSHFYCGVMSVAASCLSVRFPAARLDGTD